VSNLEDKLRIAVLRMFYKGIIMDQNKQNQINVEPFMNKINAYVFNFLPKSITGRLIEQNGDYLTIELKSGDLIVAHIDSLISIWAIRQKQEVV
jgi:hypothetical protein